MPALLMNTSHCAVLCCAVLCCAVLCCAVLADDAHMVWCGGCTQWPAHLGGGIRLPRQGCGPSQAWAGRAMRCRAVWLMLLAARVAVASRLGHVGAVGALGGRRACDPPRGLMGGLLVTPPLSTTQGPAIRAATVLRSCKG